MVTNQERSSLSSLFFMNSRLHLRPSLTVCSPNIATRQFFALCSRRLSIYFFLSCLHLLPPAVPWSVLCKPTSQPHTCANLRTPSFSLSPSLSISLSLSLSNSFPLPHQRAFPHSSLFTLYFSLFCSPPFAPSLKSCALVISSQQQNALSTHLCLCTTNPSPIL